MKRLFFICIALVFGTLLKDRSSYSLTFDMIKKYKKARGKKDKKIRKHKNTKRQRGPKGKNSKIPKDKKTKGQKDIYLIISRTMRY